MEIVHTLKDIKVSKEVDGEASFLLANKNLGYTYLSAGKRSRYEGAFFNIDGGLHRVIADISVEGEIKGIKNSFCSVIRERGENRETFFMPCGGNSLFYELEKEDWITLTLDVRHIYDTSEPAEYSFSEKESSFVVRCTRKEGEYFLVIAYDRGEKKEHEWLGEQVKSFYEADKERNSPPLELPVYRAIRIKTKKLVFSFAKEEDVAMEEAEYVLENKGELLSEQEKSVRIAPRRAFPSDETWMAYNCCLNSLDQMTYADRIPAGLPWFYQSWTRDELVAMRLMPTKTKKAILLRDLRAIAEDGRLPNMLSEPAKTNADSIGWLFARIDDELSLFTVKQKKTLKEKLVESIMWLNQSYVEDFVVYNGQQETWMDTLSRDDGREGARIEIQALALRMYRLAFRLTKNKKFSQMEMLAREQIRKLFWQPPYLWDGLEDSTIRPNSFIAAYVYFDLLPKSEWKKCFENCLRHLWCGWGGLSSIDKEHHLYVPHSTGEDPRSYHHGDSWFFLNNIAAMVLNKVDPLDFKSYVEGILAASTADILWQGMVGHHSEISSAEEQKPAGCGAQAWSAAMYIEMCDSLFFK